MSEWPERTLGDVATEVTVGFVGTMAAEYVEQGVPFLRSQNVARLRIDMTEAKFIGNDFHERLRKSKLRPGDVVIVRTGQPGTCAVIPDSLPEANCSDLVIVRPGADLDPHWLAYYVTTEGARHVHANLVGAVQQHFNVQAAKSMVLRLPSLNEQRRVAGVLRSLDDKIDLNRRTCATLEAIVRATFQSWFVDFEPVKAKAAGEAPDSICRRLGLTRELLDLFPRRMEGERKTLIPEGWKWGTIADIARNVRDCIDPSELDGATRYVGLEHMPRGSIVLDDWGDAAGLASGKFRFEVGHVLFGKLRPYFRKVAVAPFEGICSTDILVLDATEPSQWGVLVAYASSEELIDYASGSSGGTRMPRTSWADISRFPIRIPAQGIVAEFTDRVRAIEDRCRAAVFENRTLMRLRDGLLPRLMSGDLRVGKEKAGE